MLGIRLKNKLTKEINYEKTLIVLFKKDDKYHSIR